MKKKDLCQRMKTKKVKKQIGEKFETSQNNVKIDYIGSTNIFTSIRIKSNIGEDIIIKCNDLRIKEALKINNQDIRAFQLLSNKIYIYTNPSVDR